MPTVQFNFGSGSPPAWVESCVQRLLESIPGDYVAGIEAIVLTDRRAIGKGKTGRVGGRKYLRKACLGFYHHRTRHQEAWIELVVENIIGVFADPPLRRFLWFSFVQDMLVSETLYHEVGHHLDVTLGAAARPGERAADDWSRRLRRVHARKRYWYLRPVFRVMQLLKPAIDRKVKKTLAELKGGT